MILALSLALSPVGQVSQASVDRCEARPADETVAPSRVSPLASDVVFTVQVSRTSEGCSGSRLQVLAYEPSMVEVQCEGVDVAISEVRSLTPWSEPSTAIQHHRDRLLVTLAEVASGPWPAMELVLTPTQAGQATCTVVARSTRSSGRRVAMRR